MTPISDELRAEVASRAGRRCEYCRLPDELQVGGFHIDHVVPRRDGGRTAPENLAYACPHCNARKWAHTEGTDVQSQETVALFDPRGQHWADHFRWSGDSEFEIEGITPGGRATVQRLQMNHANVVAIRRLLAQLGADYGA